MWFRCNELPNLYGNITETTTTSSRTNDNENLLVSQWSPVKPVRQLHE